MKDSKERDQRAERDREKISRPWRQIKGKREIYRREEESRGENEKRNKESREGGCGRADDRKKIEITCG